MRRLSVGLWFAIASLTAISLVAPTARGDDLALIPHAQNKPPGEALTPAEAIRKMTVPKGFQVELVASEPDLVNPVAMTFDERGRIWVTESLEYPRKPAGPGRDRVRVLEDTDGDGKADKFTTFAEGFNIPSGIAVGHGGVWVANSPDLLFLQDTDGDGKADRREVVVTGFGRFDTHELPNSLTWGPDGWLYGWNGVFNGSHVVYRGKTYDFTCAIFRIHPKTRDFELFCEGTSNPWGIAWDPNGNAFSSACVIDHLWHLTETGYYHRQGGPYPPFTWKAESIVSHLHEKAAYCGIDYFDSEAYPAQYRDKLYMGNIHGNSINVDILERNGSTYFSRPGGDFLEANDAWFMPVAQKTGPDGSLYILDWYDRYHCYQDANRDPAGIDRLKGRLYRVRYGDTPRRSGFDLSRETDAQLITRLSNPNSYDRSIAQRLLAERAPSATQTLLQASALDPSVSRKGRLHALWTRISAGPLDPDFNLALLKHDDPTFRTWGVRAAGNMHKVDTRVSAAVVALARDPSPDVRLQVAIASRKLDGVDPMPVLLEVLSNPADDPLIPRIVWRNLEPLLETQADAFVRSVASNPGKPSPGLTAVLPRAFERILARRNPTAGPIASLLRLLTDSPSSNVDLARKAMQALASRVQTGELSGASLASLRQELTPSLHRILAGDHAAPLYIDAVFLAASWKDSQGYAAARAILDDAKQPEFRRVESLNALVASGDPGILKTAETILADRSSGSLEFRGQVLASLGRLDDPKVANIALATYPRLEPEFQPKVIELLTQRTSWSSALVKAVADKTIPRDALNLNQVRKLLNTKDPALLPLVRAQWGTIRESRNPEREKVISRVRASLRGRKGDPNAGQEVFRRVCAQCHKIYGEGQDVGPEITSNGRGSFDQLLSNVLDPSLVIGSAYQATTVATADGRVLTGLLVENSPERLILKMQGGKLETIPRADVDEMKISLLSLMPEDLEKQLTGKELLDLFAFISLDRHHNDPKAKPIPGTNEVVPRQTGDPKQFKEILREIAPDFAVREAGEGGVALLKEHLGRTGVLRTHPVNRETPCVIRSVALIPAGKKTHLVLHVAHDARGDWELIVKANGKTLHKAVVGPDTTRQGWTELSIDLSQFAGQTVNLELENRADDWSFEFGYWGRIEIVSE